MTLGIKGDDVSILDAFNEDSAHIGGNVSNSIPLHLPDYRRDTWRKAVVERSGADSSATTKSKSERSSKRRMVLLGMGRVVMYTAGRLGGN